MHNPSAQHHIVLNGNDVAYMLSTRRATRGIRLTVKCGGMVLVSAHRSMSMAFVEHYIRQHSAWIVRMVKQQQACPATHLRTKLLSTHKTSALALVTEKLAQMNTHYGFSYGRVSIREQTTRWGSCSKQGNLSFNVRLVLLPEPLQEYVIVHELCHVAAMNHGKRFWQLVAHTVPDYAMRRKALRQHHL